MPLLQKACCCLELATGAAILGWLGIVGSIINFIMSIIEFTQPDSSAGIFILNLVVVMLEITVSTLLIRGAMTRNRRLVVPWLAVTILNMIFINISFIYMIFTTGDLSLIASLILVDLLMGYFWVCVYSFYKQEEECPRGMV